MTVNAACENWINGNISDVLAAISDKPDSIYAAWFAVAVYQALPKTERDSFYRVLYNRAA